MTDKEWTDIASKMLIGMKITRAYYMSEADAEKLGWEQRPVILELKGEDGRELQLFPMQDDEGNDGGALATSDDENEVLPVLWVGHNRDAGF